jgi:hypothetical protein
MSDLLPNIDPACGTCGLGAGLAGVRARVRLGGAWHDLLLGATVRRQADGGIAAETAASGALLTLVLHAGDGVQELALSVAAGAVPVAIDEVELATIPLAGLPHPATALRFWRDWHDIWYAVGSKPLGLAGGPADVDSEIAYGAGGVYAGDGVWSLLALWRQPCAHQALVAVEDGALVARLAVGTELAAQRTWRSDRLRLCAGLPMAAALAALHRGDSPRRAPAEARDHCGWNSWEAYHGRITAADMVENAEAIAAIPWLRARIRYLTVDDGWQRTYGDWEPNARFSDGMDDLARRLEALGFQAGIWTAPFLAEEGAPLLAQHPDWVLRDADGPVGMSPKVRVLDPTHPGVREHVFRLYQKLRSWGFRAFKTDFLRDASMYATPHRPEFRPTLRLHDPALGIVRGMRAAMQAIRAGIGEDAFWLGCGSDISAGAGLMDASRTGGDIGPYWTRVPHQARSVIHHGHLHGALFLADPDFLLVKGPDTCRPGLLDVPADSGKPYEVDAWTGGPANDLAAVRAWASLVILSGGVVNLGDRLAILNQQALEVIRTVLELAGGAAAVPLDWDQPIPRVLLRRERGECLLGLFNWSPDQEQTVEAGAGVPFPASGVVAEVWTGAAVACPGGRLACTLPPRSARLLRWRDPGCCTA